MQRIRPHIWYDTQAVEAAELYSSTFPGSRITDVTTLHGTPTGDTDIVTFELLGLGFQAISAGMMFPFSPSISFLVSSQEEAEVEAFWHALSAGGKTIMPLEAYPFSKRYGWTEDRYGLSWQIGHFDQPRPQRITPTLMFAGAACGKAEEAIGFYTSVFGDSRAGEVVRYGKGEEPDREGTIKHADFVIEGRTFAAMDSARVPDAAFNEAVSLMVRCDTQDEIDRYWNALSAAPQSEQCGWLKDRYGVSWQIVPTAMDDMLINGSEEQIARVTEAFLKMKKFDLAELQRAYEGKE